MKAHGGNGEALESTTSPLAIFRGSHSAGAPSRIQHFGAEHSATQASPVWLYRYSDGYHYAHFMEFCGEIRVACSCPA